MVHKQNKSLRTDARRGLHAHKPTPSHQPLERARGAFAPWPVLTRTPSKVHKPLIKLPLTRNRCHLPPLRVVQRHVAAFSWAHEVELAHFLLRSPRPLAAINGVVLVAVAAAAVVATFSFAFGLNPAHLHTRTTHNQQTRSATDLHTHLLHTYTKVSVFEVRLCVCIRLGGPPSSLNGLDSPHDGLAPPLRGAFAVLVERARPREAACSGRRLQAGEAPRARAKRGSRAKRQPTTSFHGPGAEPPRANTTDINTTDMWPPSSLPASPRRSRSRLGADCPDHTLPSQHGMNRRGLHPLRAPQLDACSRARKHT